MTAPHLTSLPARLQWTGQRLSEILLDSDITFACVVLGFGAILWGIFGLIYPADLVWFAGGFALEVAPWFWGLNSMVVGYGFVHVALHNFPQGRCLMLGSYCIMCWTWIALGRPASSFSSGMTLNFVIIFMGALLIQRTGRRR